MTSTPSPSGDKSFHEGTVIGGGLGFINPGSGPVAEATIENARANMPQFCKDCEAQLPDGWVVVWDEADPDKEMVESGRFQFTATSYAPGAPETAVCEHEVDMPGLPLDQVRYMKEGDQNIWDFPRLYVDGSSWVWLYAINLHDDEDEDEDDG